jgi:hypothetical protein
MVTATNSVYGRFTASLIEYDGQGLLLLKQRGVHPKEMQIPTAKRQIHDIADLLGGTVVDAEENFVVPSANDGIFYSSPLRREGDTLFAGDPLPVTMILELGLYSIGRKFTDRDWIRVFVDDQLVSELGTERIPHTFMPSPGDSFGQRPMKGLGQPDPTLSHPIKYKTGFWSSKDPYRRILNLKKKDEQVFVVSDLPSEEHQALLQARAAIQDTPFFAGYYSFLSPAVEDVPEWVAVNTRLKERFSERLEEAMQKEM